MNAGSWKQEAGSSQNPDRADGYRRLIAWQKADDLAVALYLALKKAAGIDPWLRSQANRAAFSVPANIAEGYARGSLPDYLHFLDFAKGSLAEVDYAIHFMRRAELLPPSVLADLESRCRETGRVLQGLWRTLKAKLPREWNHTAARASTGSYITEEMDIDEIE